MKIYACVLAFISLVLTAPSSVAQNTSELAPGSPNVIATAALANTLQAPDSEKPLILNVGPWLLFRQAHIPNAEYVGSPTEKQNLEQLRAKVKSLPRNKTIVLYCGCCPWDQCPNIRPAFKELQAMGFTNVKALYIPNNFGADWVAKGYPTLKGQ